MIDGYTFGQIQIDGQVYRKDVIILPDGTVVHPWWRGAGHRLVLDDIQAALATHPDVVIVGSGSPGFMQPDPACIASLERDGIATVVLPTPEAVDESNRRTGREERVATCLHLTC